MVLLFSVPAAPGGETKGVGLEHLGPGHLAMVLVLAESAALSALRNVAKTKTGRRCMSDGEFLVAGRFSSSSYIYSNSSMYSGLGARVISGLFSVFSATPHGATSRAGS